MCEGKIIPNKKYEGNIITISINEYIYSEE